MHCCSIFSNEQESSSLIRMSLTYFFLGNRLRVGMDPFVFLVGVFWSVKHLLSLRCCPLLCLGRGEGLSLPTWPFSVPTRGRPDLVFKNSLFKIRKKTVHISYRKVNTSASFFMLALTVCLNCDSEGPPFRSG